MGLPTRAWLQRRVPRECPALRERSSIAAPAALYSLDDAQVDPFQLTSVLLHRAQAGGLRIFPRSRVKHVRRPGDTKVLETETGRVTAKSIVFSGGYESVDWIAEDVGQLHSTYVVTSEPLSSFEGWPDSCLIWETARPYFYARQTLDGRAMIGGEDTPSGDDHQDSALLEAKVERLQARFHELFPQLTFVPAYAWAGTCAASRKTASRTLALRQAATTSASRWATEETVLRSASSLPA